MTASWTVEVRFDGSTWTDISDNVRQMSVRRGRANDLSTVEPGVLTVELDNNDGRFTPENSQGAYYPNVVPTVSVRVSVSAGEGPTEYRLFTGDAERWEPQWTVGGRPIVLLECVDGFERLNNHTLEYLYKVVALDNSPDGYWPLSGSAPHADLSGNDLSMRWAGADVTYGADALIEGSDGALSLTGAASSDDIDPAASRSLPSGWDESTQDITFSAMFRYDTLDDASGARIDLIGARDQANTPLWSFQISKDGMVFTVNNGSSFDNLAPANFSWTEGQVYQVGFHWDVSAKTVTFYRDGVSKGSDTTTVTMADIGNGVLEFLADHITPNAVTVSDYVLWMSDQSSLMSSLSDAVDGYPSDSPEDRIGRVLDLAGWDASARDIDTGTTPLAGFDSGTSALQACQDAAAADGGVFYISRTGDAVFQSRRGRWEDASGTEYSDTYSDTYGSVGGAVVALDDDGTDTGYQAVGWRFDTTLLHNEITVNSNTQGTSDGLAEDSTSQSTYGTRTLSISTISNNSADNAERAQWELSRRKDPHLQLEEVSFLVADEVQEDTAAPMELQDRVDVFRRPGAGQDDLEVELRVASIDHQVSDGGKVWRTTIGLLEAGTDQPGVYDAAVYGTDYYGY